MLWLALTVAQFAAHVLALFAPRPAMRQLRRYARWTWGLVVVQAMRGVVKRRAPLRRHHNFIPARALTMRRMAGSALRRALRARTPPERACAICAVLTNPTRWIARLARRMRRRFTKLRALPRGKDAFATEALAAALSAIAILDSS